MRWLSTTSALFFVAILAAAPLSAQVSEEAQQLLGPGFTLDEDRSAEGREAAGHVFGLLYGELPDYRTETAVYRFDGTLEAAFEAIRVPERANVTAPRGAHVSDPLSMMLLLMERRADVVMGEKGKPWQKQAEVRVQEWGGLDRKQFQIEIGMDALTGDGPEPGTKVHLIGIEGGSPWVDLIGLKTVDGTWVQISETTFTVPSGPAGAGWGEDEDDDVLDEDDLGVALYPGIIRVDAQEFEHVLFGGENYFLAEAPLQQVEDFYIETSGERHCQVDDRSVAIIDDEEQPLVTILCMDHEGEAGEGDEVTAVLLTVPPGEVLSRTAGRNQGTWTLISYERFAY